MNIFKILAVSNYHQVKLLGYPLNWELSFNMAKQQQQDKKVGFKSIELLKDLTLGVGSYGQVCKAKCDNLLCAAKILHPTLFDPTVQHQIAPQKEHRLPIRRFELECEFLSTVRHPNIVQYLGMHQDLDTGLPVLLIELMDDSLTHYLESSPRSISYHIQVNLFHDIVVALSYLHTNNIVHRDLSSNNVLLIGNIRAKVADFGMARFSDLNPQVTDTMCPGTNVYMPPEAVDDKPVYTEKIDCFSLGVIIVQILTGQFPNPGDRQVTVNDPRYPQGALKLCVPEVERRRNHISKVDPNHPLLKIALDCLKDKDVERPSAQELCDSVAALKESSEYQAAQDQVTSKDRNHAQQVKHLQLIILSQLNRLEEKEHILGQCREEIQRLEREKGKAMEEKVEIMRQMRQETQRLEREKDQAVEEREENVRQLRQKTQQLEGEKNQAVKEREEEVRQLRQLRQMTQQLEREKNQAVKEREGEVRQLRQEIQQLKREKDQAIEENEEKVRQLSQEIQQLEREKNQAVKEREGNVRQLRHETQQLKTEKDQAIEEKEEKMRQLSQEIQQLEREKNQAVKEREGNVRQLRHETQRLKREKDQVIEEKGQIRQETQRLEREKNQAVEEREEKVRQLRNANQKLEESEQVIADFGRRITELEQQLSQKDQPQTQRLNASNRKESGTSIKWRWTEGDRAPRGMVRAGSAVVVGNSMVYFVYGRNSIYTYNDTNKNWSPTPYYPPCSGFAITVINGLLTTIGGYQYSLEYTNQLFTLTGEGSGQKWTEEFPPMPTKRFGVIALCTGTAVIVAGGLEKHDQNLKTVEVMNTETHQWSTAADLPEPLRSYSLTACDGYVYQLGGYDQGDKQVKSAYSCSLTTLLSSCHSKSLGKRLARTLSRSSKKPGSIWNRVADLPVAYSTCVSHHSQLLAIGGKDSDDIFTTAIHMYHRITNSWEVVSHMATPRALCLAAVLPDNQLMIVGGTCRSGTDHRTTDSVEFANVIHS